MMTKSFMKRCIQQHFASGPPVESKIELSDVEIHRHHLPMETASNVTRQQQQPSVQVVDW